MGNKDNIIIISNGDDWEILYVNGEKVLATHSISLRMIMDYLPNLSQPLTLTLYEYFNDEWEDRESDELYREVFMTNKYKTFEQLEPLLQNDNFKKY